MAEELTEEQRARLKATVALMGKLLIARKDIKAIEVKLSGGYGWVPDRERVPPGQDPTSGALIPMRMSDFEEHFTGKRCMGTYLLDTDSMTKFIAFDVDLKKQGRWYAVHDTETLAGQSAGLRPWDMDEVMVSGILDLETHVGNLEAALHNPADPAHRWARIILDQTSFAIKERVLEVLGLKSMVVLTGGGTHVLVPFGSLVPASEAREAARAVMDACGYAPTKGDNFFAVGDPDSGVEIEVFPKQDTIPADGFGNLIRLPLGWHNGAKRRTRFVDMGDARIAMQPVWEFATAPALDLLERVAESLGVLA